VCVCKRRAARVVSEPLADDSELATVVLCDSIIKAYSADKIAVKGVSFGIQNGQCFGLLGPNGAGKSTLFKVLTGVESPEAGRALIGGYSVQTNPEDVYGFIGVCPQNNVRRTADIAVASTYPLAPCVPQALFDLLSAREHLYLYARIKGMREADIPAAVQDLITRMDLGEYADRISKEYSGGNKRKVRAHTRTHSSAFSLVCSLAIAALHGDRFHRWTASRVPR